MKKKPAKPAPRPQDAMARFDRLLATMAPKAELPTKKPIAPRGTSARKKISREAAKDAK